MASGPPRAPRWVFVVVVLFVWSLTTHGKFSVTGDEPHYLMVAESLRTDGDLDVRNNYQRGDGRQFGAPGGSTFGWAEHARVTRQSALWSTHDIGVPVLILPAYTAAVWLAGHVNPATLARFRQTPGLFAYSLVSLTLIVLTAWAACRMLSVWQRIAPQRWAVATILILVLSPPVLSHAFLVFPEVFAFAVACGVIWFAYLERDEVSLVRAVAVTGALGAMPWLHRKYSFFAFGLALFLAWRQRSWVLAQPRRVLAALLALVVLPQVALHVWTLWAWGHLGGPFMLERVPFSLSGVQTGALGMLFDRERGLFGYAPIYLLAPACWALTWRESRLLLIPVLSLFLPLAAFDVWWAGFSPGGRFLVPLAPFLILPMAVALDRGAVKVVAALLVTFQGAITLIAWRYPRLLWPKELGTNQILEKIPLLGPAYEQALPSLLTGDPLARAWIAAAVLVAVTAAIVAIDAQPASNRAWRDR